MLDQNSDLPPVGDDNFSIWLIEGYQDIADSWRAILQSYLGGDVDVRSFSRVSDFFSALKKAEEPIGKIFIDVHTKGGDETEPLLELLKLQKQGEEKLRKVLRETIFVLWAACPDDGRRLLEKSRVKFKEIGVDVGQIVVYPKCHQQADSMNSLSEMPAQDLAPANEELSAAPQSF